MRQITIDSIEAFNNAEKFNKSNTSVEVLPNVTILKLHGNPIAYQYNDPDRTLTITNAGWATPTTKERLNGITGVNIYQKKGIWYLNEQEWDGKIITINN